MRIFSFFFICTLVLALGCSGVSAEVPVQPDLNKSSDWEIVGGDWEFKDGTVTQTRVGEEEGDCLLRWKGQLPDRPFQITFGIQTYESKSDPFPAQAYLVVRSDASGKSGYGFGFRRKGGKQIWWKDFPSNTGVDQIHGISGKNWGRSWQKMSLANDGPSYELYYPKDGENTQPADQLIMRGYMWGHAGQKGLVLRTNGSKATFSNIKIRSLSEVPVVNQFGIVVPENGAEVETTRPVLKWETSSSENRREDFNYHVVITHAQSGKVVAEDVVQEMMYRPDEPLAVGTYGWTVEARTFNGTVRGGEFAGTFVVPSDAQRDFGALNVTGPEPSCFDTVPPALTWTWDENGNAVDRVEIYRGEKLVSKQKVSDADKVAWKPDGDLAAGLNRFAVKLYHKNQLIESVDTFAVRTRIPAQYTIREDGVLLRDGKVFVPVVTYRDPSDDYMQTDGIEEAGFTVTHSYHFDGPHHYSIKKHKLEQELSRENLERLINDARDYLRLCDSKGIKVALSLRRSWVYNGKFDYIREFVAALMGEPGLLTWYIYDEPDYVGVSLASVRDAYSAIKEVDTYHPVSLIYAHPNLIPRMMRSSDILWSQAYHLDMSDIMRHIDTQFRARKESAEFGTNFNNPNPLASWTILAAHDLLVYKKKTSTFSEHSPVVESAYAAMISGARGVAYYWLPNSVYDIRTDVPQIWSAVVDASQQLNAIMPYLLAEGEELKVPSDKEGIVARARRLDDGKVVVVLLNTRKEGKELFWQWDVSLKQAKKIAGEGQVEVSAGKLIVALKPLGGVAIILED